MANYIIGLLILILFSGCSATGLSEENKTDTCCNSNSTANKNSMAKISSESIYQLADSFQTQDGKNQTLAFFSGKPTVIGMVFTNCAFACPILTADIKKISTTLNDEEVNYVLVSFDTKRDTSERLKLYAKEYELKDRWTLLHGTEESVRTLSVLLNVQYEKDEEGNFTHSNIVSVLNKQGVLQFQKEGLGTDHSETINILKSLSKK